MKRTSTLSSQNQIVVPSEVRKALGLRPGEVVVFDVRDAARGNTVTLRRHPTLAELAGSVPVPPEAARLSWQEIRARAWAPENSTVDERVG
ncbi:MAG: AbrB/MazE/SpoVT family DNA-binding domain-containing protein [Chloroflexota bacterium]|nr:MAG: AbrB family transcriptional regulator [Chloroflexota bacterium]